MTRKPFLTIPFAMNLAAICMVGWVGVVALVGVVVGVEAAEQVATEPALVATRVLTPSRYEVELPERVGALLAGKQQTLAFETQGRLETLITEGQRVVRGELVAQLDNSLERLKLRRAEILLTQARTELERFSQLARLRVTSPADFENAESTVELRIAERDLAREQLSRTQLVAPFDGFVVEHLRDPGEFVAAGSPIATLMDLDTVRLEVGVPGYQSSRVAVGQRVAVAVRARPTESFTGTVRRVARATAEGDRLFEVEIEIPNPDGQLAPGMTARTRILLEVLEDAIVIPVEALVDRDGHRTAYFAWDGRAREVDVSKYLPHDGVILLTADMPYRELIVAGHQTLREGQSLRIDGSVLRQAIDR